MLVALEVDLVGYTPAGSEPHFVTNTHLHRSLLYRSSFLPKVFFVENKAHHNRILNCPGNLLAYARSICLSRFWTSSVLWYELCPVAQGIHMNTS